MSRPTKTGIPYYNVDTDIFLNRDIKRLIKSFNGKGFMIYMYVLTELYRDKGYFLRWDEDTAFDVSDELNVSQNLVADVIDFCCNKGLFCKELCANEKVLTSRNIQQRWLKIVKGAKRKVTDIEVSYSLVKFKTPEETLKTPEETPLKREETTPKGEESTQSKVKESKVNRILSYSLKNARGEIRSIESPKDFLHLWNKFREHYDKKPSNRNILELHNQNKLKKLKNHFGIEDFITALNALFKSSSFQHCRTDPSHFLSPEHFQNYLDSGQTGKKLFEDKKQKIEKL